MTQIFKDRLGNDVPLPADKTSGTRHGVFAICLCKDHVLLIWPDYAPDVPDLPGGGVDEGETTHQALLREFFEETGMRHAFPDKPSDFQQDVYFYADDLEEYWLYTQEFYVFRFEETEIYFEDTRDNPENGTMRWIPLSELENTTMHALHKKALKALNILT